MRKKALTFLCVIMIAGLALTGCSSSSSIREDLFGSASIGGISNEVNDYIAQYEECKERDELTGTGNLYDDGLSMSYLESEEGGYYYILLDSNLDDITGQLTYWVRDNVVYKKCFTVSFTSDDFRTSDYLVHSTDAQGDAQSFFNDWLKKINKTYEKYSSYDNNSPSEFYTSYEEYTWDETDYDIILNYVGMDDTNYNVYILYQLK